MGEKMETKKVEYILEAIDLCKYFKAGRKQYVKAVDHVNIRICSITISVTSRH